LSSVLSNDATTHAVNAQVQRERGRVGGVAGVVQETGSLSAVLPPGCFAVPCKNGRMYGKHVHDIHLGGFSVEMDCVNDRVIRFRKNDHKTAVADMLVAMGRYAKVKTAQEIILKMIERKDDKIKDLESLEIDMDLLENKVCMRLSIQILKFVLYYGLSPGQHLIIIIKICFVLWPDGLSPGQQN